MSAKFTEEEKEKLRTEMIQLGFTMLKSGGIRNVNIDTITKNALLRKVPSIQFSRARPNFCIRL